MFWVRLRSSILLMIIAITSILLGGPVLFCVVSATALIGLMELYRVFQVNKKLTAYVGYFASAAYLTLLFFRKEELILILLLGFLLLLMAVFVFTFPDNDIKDISIVFFGMFYVVVMLSFVYRVRMMENGSFLVWLIFIGGWGSDTCAYLVGITLGKHKITPVLSPKKTVEGCLGGVIGAALIGFIYATVFKHNLHTIHNPQLTFAITGAAGSILSQIGDLAASGIKRQYSIKDYGKLIPGHGGVLDRFDSIIFTAPVCFALLMLLK